MRDKKRRGIPVEEATNKEILRKQLEMLAERSVSDGCFTRDLIKIGRAENEIYRSLEMSSCKKLMVCIVAFWCLGLPIIKKLDATKKRNDFAKKLSEVCDRRKETR